MTTFRNQAIRRAGLALAFAISVSAFSPSSGFAFTAEDMGADENISAWRDAVATLFDVDDNSRTVETIAIPTNGRQRFGRLRECAATLVRLPAAIKIAEREQR